MAGLGSGATYTDTAPLSGHVTRDAERYQVAEPVGLFVSRPSEGSERHEVVNVEFAPRFSGTDTAVLTDSVALPRGTPSVRPRSTVVESGPATPSVAVLSDPGAAFLRAEAVRLTTPDRNGYPAGRTRSGFPCRRSRAFRVNLDGVLTSLRAVDTLPIRARGSRHCATAYGARRNGGIIRLHQVAPGVRPGVFAARPGHFASELYPKFACHSWSGTFSILDECTKELQ